MNEFESIIGKMNFEYRLVSVEIYKQTNEIEFRDRTFGSVLFNRIQPTVFSICGSIQKSLNYSNSDE